MEKKGTKIIIWNSETHFNPALDPDGPARKAIEARGFKVLGDGDVLPL
jgi:hypothetical protein